ncbi:luciferin 4-monooxygenase-like [Leptopilina heterotoma]|uniref:luciferin 4-monooxygenase-like n=1 Tax=Leptopilina heterotoma TaxID=63436 RepID=UPI001CA98CAC|nr:luciferin 4-monooxygenase-like [Leptopilina heterotoma]
MENNTKIKDNILYGPPFEKEFPYESIGEYFLETMEKHGPATALINMESGEQLSHREVLEKSLKLATYLNKLGLDINDRIAICSENNLNFSIAVLSSIFLGTAICPLNPIYTERELIHSLNISKPKFIFVSGFVLARMQKIIKDLSWSPKLILLYDIPNCSVPSIAKLISKVSDYSVKNFRLPKIDKSEHVSIIACSSGTTGLPKGVMLTDKNVLNQLRHFSESRALKLTDNISVLGLLPLFHAYGLFVSFLIFSSGAKLIVLSRFDERLFLEAISKYKIDSLTLVPPLMVFLAKSPIVDEYDLSCVNEIACGAAPLSKEIALAVQKRLNVPYIKTGYGLTEATLSVISSFDIPKPQSVGILVHGVIAKVISLDGKSNAPLGPLCEGELCFKGDTIMKGYCDDEEATRATIDEDGFLHTGDVGYYDDEGYFYIVDRVKELIKYKGFQVPPAELESILLSHSAIKDAAVVGLADELAGELPLAFVVKQPGVNVSPAEIIQYVNERVSAEKKLRGGVRFVEAIPKNPSGKILRRELRNLLKSRL